MSANFNDLLQQGLEQAVVQHVCKLFDVLMSAKEGDKEACEHFVNGVNKLARTEQLVREQFPER